MESKKLDLLQGNIFKSLLKLSMPLMATAFVEMAYNMTDTAWLGRLGKNVVAGTGSAHFFVWIGYSIILIGKVGTGVFVSQDYGRSDKRALHNSIKNGLALSVILALLYTAFILFFANSLIGFYKLENDVSKIGVTYLRIYSLGLLPGFLNLVISGIYNSLGNSVLPFKVNVIGLVANVIIDPIMIFGLGPIPAMGYVGAAIATTFAQTLVLLIFIKTVVKDKNEIYEGLKKGIISLKNMGDKFSLGFPAGFQSFIHAAISLVLSRFMTSYGTEPIAVYTVGAMLESITYMTTEGFQGGIIAFVGQNYGAEKMDRLKAAIKTGMEVVGAIGIFSTIVLIGFRSHLFKLFMPTEVSSISMGAAYLLILGVSQLPMSLEIGAAGVFNGLGQTKVPAFISMIFNAIRVPIAVLLMPSFQFYGVWAAMSISSILKGLILNILLYKRYKKL